MKLFWVFYLERNEMENKCYMAEKNQKNRKIKIDKHGYKRDEKGWFVKGTKPGPGRKYRDFFTDFKQAAKEIAEKLEIKDKEKVERIYIELMKQGIKSGLKGNYNFWKDITERTYGKEPDKMEGELEINVINYGQLDNTISIPAEMVSTSYSAKQSKKQGGGDAQEVGQDKGSAEPTDNKSS